MAAAHHLAVLKLKLLTANHFRDTFCIVKSDFVEVGRTVAEMSHFFAFLVKCKNLLLDDRA